MAQEVEELTDPVIMQDEAAKDTATEGVSVDSAPEALQEAELQETEEAVAEQEEAAENVVVAELAQMDEPVEEPEAMENVVDSEVVAAAAAALHEQAGMDASAPKGSAGEEALLTCIESLGNQ